MCHLFYWTNKSKVNLPTCWCSRCCQHPHSSLGPFSLLQWASSCQYLHLCVWGLPLQGQFVHGQQVRSWGIIFPLPQQASSRNSLGLAYKIPQLPPPPVRSFWHCVLHYFPRFPQGIQFQAPTLAADLRAHPLLDAFPSLFPSPTIVLSPIPINNLHLNPCLEVCFWRTKTKSQH